MMTRTMLIFARYKRAVAAIVGLALLADPAVAARSPVRFAALGTAGTAGTLDPTFGRSGFTLIAQNVYSVNDVRVEQNGDVLIAEDVNGLPGANAVASFAVVRLLPDGALDKGFGTGGVAVARFSPGINPAMSIAVQPDGKIVAVGVQESLLPRMELGAVARFTSGGALDASFGNGGRVTIAFPAGNDSAVDTVLVLPNGRILVGGGARSTSVVSGALVQLNSDGSLDTTFGTRGFAAVALGTGINGLGLQADGKIVALAGTRAVRVMPNGSIDANQTLSTLIAETHNGASTLTPSERVTAVEGLGDGSLNDVDTEVLRLFPNGMIDPSFRTVLFDFAQSTPDILSNVGRAVLVQPDGSVVVGGGGQPSAGVTEFGIARLLQTGAFDPTFGRRGISLSLLNGNDEITALAMQPNGEIVAAGQSFTRGAGLVVARYLSR